MTAVQTTQSPKIVDYYDELNISLDATKAEINLALQQAEWSIRAMTQAGKTTEAAAKKSLLEGAREVFASDTTRAEYNQKLVDEGIITQEDLEPKSEVKEGKTNNIVALDKVSEAKLLKITPQWEGNFAVTAYDKSTKAELNRLLPLVTLIQYQDAIRILSLEKGGISNASLISDVSSHGL